MVAKIISGKNIRGILHYNEDKVAKGQASLILASGFSQEVAGMTVKQKYERFESLTMLRPKAKTNALHISLNFHPSENLNNNILQQIAASYMRKIGFDEQPFLVYRHTDAAHAHVHIATTIIKSGGQRMDIHNIGKRRSEPARKAIEKEFDLIPAEIKQKRNPGIRPLSPRSVQYGKAPTKQGITSIVRAVMRSYHFNSLAEFNAILRQFNVQADRGQPGSPMYEKKGLQYSILDANGRLIGVPIKASAIYGKPTLKNLEKKFERNQAKPKTHKEDLKQRIVAALKPYDQITSRSFVNELQRRQVGVVFRKNESGFTYGVTFVDHKNRIVFNGSQLGKVFSAKALTERFATSDELHAQPVRAATYLDKMERRNQTIKKPIRPVKTYLKPVPHTSYLKGMFAENSTDDPPPVLPRKRKKNRKGLQL